MAPRRPDPPGTPGGPRAAVAPPPAPRLGAAWPPPAPSRAVPVARRRAPPARRACDGVRSGAAAARAPRPRAGAPAAGAATAAAGPAGDHDVRRPRHPGAAHRPLRAALPRPAARRSRRAEADPVRLQQRGGRAAGASATGGTTPTYVKAQARARLAHGRCRARSATCNARPGRRTTAPRRPAQCRGRGPPGSDRTWYGTLWQSVRDGRRDAATPPVPAPRPAVTSVTPRR